MKRIVVNLLSIVVISCVMHNIAAGETYKPLANGIEIMLRNKQFHADLAELFSKYIQSSLTTSVQKQQARDFLNLLQEGFAFDWDLIDKQRSEYFAMSSASDEQADKSSVFTQLKEIGKKQPLATVRRLNSVVDVQKLMQENKSTITIDLQQLYNILEERNKVAAKAQALYTEDTMPQLPAELQKFQDWEQRFSMQRSLLLDSLQNINTAVFIDLLRPSVQKALDVVTVP